MESNTIDKVIDALKAIVRLTLCQGFSKTNYLVINHIKYIKIFKLSMIQRNISHL